MESATAARLHKLRREVEAVQECVAGVQRIATEQRFALFQAWGAVLYGWVLAEGDEVENGIGKMRQGLAALRDIGVEVALPEQLYSLAGAYGKAGQVEEGLHLVAEALSRVEKTGERKFEAELNRLQGELLLGRGEPDRCCHDAETCFQHALEVARRQRAKSWELRAAMSLTRLWQRQG